MRSRTRANIFRRGPQNDAVSQSRLIKQLRREISANPKKALFLGLLILVALYFWAPLVCGWFTEDDSPATTAAADAEAELPSAAPAQPKTPPEQEAEGLRHPWQQLVHWMDNDPRTLPAILPPEQRDPFLSPKPQVAEEDTQDKPKTVPPETTPEGLGMVLSSTIIGPRRRLARISGKTYKLGQSVTLEKDGQQVTFKLVELHPRRVVLEREGKRFDLKIPSHHKSGRIELAGSNKDP